MSEDMDQAEQAELDAKAAELSDQDLENVAGGQAIPKPPPPPPTGGGPWPIGHKQW